MGWGDGMVTRSIYRQINDSMLGTERSMDHGAKRAGADVRGRGDEVRCQVDGVTRRG